MNIDSIKIYSADSISKPKRKNTNGHGFKENSVDLCNKKSVNRGYYGGSLTSFGAAANSYSDLGKPFCDKIFSSKKFQWLLDTAADQAVNAQALVALVVAGGLRPATNLAMAGKKDKEDSIYAASHAISSALIGFAVSSIVMAPFNKAFRMIKDNPKQYLQGLEKLFGIKEIGKRKLEKSIAYKKLRKMAQFIPDTLVLGIPKAMLTIALIPPILKYVFHMEKGKKTTAPQQAEQQNMNFAKTQLNSPVFKSVQGGME